MNASAKGLACPDGAVGWVTGMVCVQAHEDMPASPRHNPELPSVDGHTSLDQVPTCPHPTDEPLGRRSAQGAEGAQTAAARLLPYVSVHPPGRTFLTFHAHRHLLHFLQQQAFS